MKSDPGSLGGYTIKLEFPADIPLRLLNNYGVNLTLDEHRDALEAEVAAVKPKLVLIDPLYLVFGGADTDRASLMYPYLAWLLQLRNNYHCAIGIVHHFSKKPTSPGSYARRSGQRLLGTTTLHGWVDSALYCEAVEEDRPGWVGARIEVEFRNMPPGRPLDLRFRWGKPGDLRMQCEVSKYDLTSVIVEAVSDEPGITAIKLAERLGIDKRTVMGRARDSDLITLEGGRRGRGHSWRLYVNGDGQA
jgi:hypothetical protein